jgi:two-component system nitrate/nitrite response regulator NarL
MADLVLGDEHVIFGEALAGLLKTHGFVVRAVAHNISRVLAAVREHQPDLCLLDRYFVEGDGIDAIGDIHHASACTRVVMLTADHDLDGMLRALRAGAQGYVHKSSQFAVLADAIGRILNGDGVVVEVPGQQVPRPSEYAAARRLAALLTARERECLGLIVEGLGTDAMAKRLGISHTTVRTHSQRLLTKLGVHSRLEAASFAVRYSLAVPPGRTSPYANLL